MAAQILEIQELALFIHCFNHSLNLSAKDAIEAIKLIKKALGTAFELIKMIKNSPKREQLLKRIKEEYLDCNSVGIKTFCPTRWTVKNEALYAILHNYKFLIQVLEESIDDANTTEKLRIKMEGVLYNMNKFEFFCGISIGFKLLEQSDNLAKSL